MAWKKTWKPLLCYLFNKKILVYFNRPKENGHHNEAVGLSPSKRKCTSKLFIKNRFTKKKIFCLSLWKMVLWQEAGLIFCIFALSIITTHTFLIVRDRLGGRVLNSILTQVSHQSILASISFTLWRSLVISLYLEKDLPFI